ncbi:hypothetical protein CRM89_29900 [Nocardia sp. FDAARGOS_372]|uniref:Uncharacterized protein n=1 Tax=Nocardia farcinica (strain IFM 10152) TaxID=247156 RepID=Q5YM54_NOCFA|nr:hypothetical protein CRM89_29900 [Nocardia sp. FDAARGOS_372]BAD60737.1 hypothetical protein PNF2_510 [Nocardia farcinica IFM 10152]
MATPARCRASIWWSRFCSAVETRPYPINRRKKHGSPGAGRGKANAERLGREKFARRRTAAGPPRRRSLNPFLRRPTTRTRRHLVGITPLGNHHTGIVGPEHSPPLAWSRSARS